MKGVYGDILSKFDAEHRCGADVVLEARIGPVYPVGGV